MPQPTSLSGSSAKSWVWAHITSPIGRDCVMAGKLVDPRAKHKDDDPADSTPGNHASGQPGISELTEQPIQLLWILVGLRCPIFLELERRP